MIFNLIQHLMDGNEEEIIEKVEEKPLTNSILYKFVSKEFHNISGQNFIENSMEYQWMDGFSDKLLVKRAFHASDFYENQIFIFGGLMDGKFSNDSLILEKGKELKKLKSIENPSARVLHTLNAFYSNQNLNLYLFGGLDFKMNYSNEFFTYDFKLLDWKLNRFEGDALPFVAGHTSVISHRKSLILFGGFGKFNQSFDYSNEIYEIYLKFNDCSKIHLSNPPSKRSGHSCGLIGEKIFIFGGHNEKGILDDLHMISYENSWHCQFIRIQGPKPSLTHSSPILKLNSNSFMLMGGFNGKKYSNLVYKFDVKTSKWILLMNQNELETNDGVCHSSIIKSKDSIFKIGGIKDVVKVSLPEVLNSIDGRL
jgi:hypothetical protein